MSDIHEAASADIDWRFETARIRARLLDSRDRDLYRNLYTDPAVMAHIGAAMSDAEADAVFEKALGYNAEWPMRARYWQLSEIGSGDPAGLLSNLRAARDPGQIELGIMLLPHRQRQRIGEELSMKIIALLMEDHWTLGVQTIIARNAPTNASVDSLTTRLGFEPMASASDAQKGWRLTRRQRSAIDDG